MVFSHSPRRGEGEDARGVVNGCDAILNFSSGILEKEEWRRFEPLILKRRYAYTGGDVIRGGFSNKIYIQPLSTACLRIPSSPLPGKVTPRA